MSWQQQQEIEEREKWESQEAHNKLKEESKMGLIAKKPEGDFEITPAGTFTGTCFWVVDLGMQETEYQGETKIQHKVYIAFELTTEKMMDGRPFMTGNSYTLSLSENAKLRAHLESWRGRKFTDQELEGFDLQTILGKSCSISIIHNTGNNGKTYANISSIGSPMKGVTITPPINECIFYSLEDNDIEAFSKLPGWLRNKVNTKAINQEPAQQSENPMPDDFIDDDIPF